MRKINDSLLTLNQQQLLRPKSTISLRGEKAARLVALPACAMAVVICRIMPHIAHAYSKPETLGAPANLACEPFPAYVCLPLSLSLPSSVHVIVLKAHRSLLTLQ